MLLVEIRDALNLWLWQLNLDIVRRVITISLELLRDFCIDHAYRTARRDTLVPTRAIGATRTTRVQGRRHSVDWVDIVHFTFSRSYS